MQESADRTQKVLSALGLVRGIHLSTMVFRRLLPWRSGKRRLHGQTKRSKLAGIDAVKNYDKQQETLQQGNLALQGRHAILLTIHAVSVFPAFLCLHILRQKSMRYLQR